ncbi:MAG TPA: ammonium transporter [Hyphomicrobium sp.]|nr:ammonium transporter [Hyphomicrobium sp.]
MTKRAAKRLTSTLVCFAATVAITQPAAAAPDTGNTGFLMMSTALVLLMTVPGLALFYCGMVRAKNALTTLLHVFATVCLVCVLWLLYGYSLAFTNGGDHNSWVGGFSKAFLAGVTASSQVATFSNGVMVPEFAYICFQMTFAAITPALIVGAFAERMRFGPLLAFMALWLTFVYAPIAHMVWYWSGPDAIATAAAALRDAAELDKPAAQALLDATLADAGLMYRWGAIDFAGGTVVHVNSGIAGLVAAVTLGPRYGYGRDAMQPHSLPLCLVGACLLWVGWFGFNCGSNLEANGTAALAMVNTFGAAATAGLAWMFAEWSARGRPTLLGIATGVVAGLVAVTPASGFAGPMGALALGALAGPICFFFCTTVRNIFGYDDSLDVFGVHCVGGIIGALATGILVNPALGGTGVLDYISSPGEAVVAAYDFGAQMSAQAKAVGLTLLWSGVGTAIILRVIQIFTTLRAPIENEYEGLDIAEHGERAYS